MINRLVEASLRVKGLVILAVIAVIAYGMYTYRRMPVDAFPDISPIMVPVFAEGHGMAPEEIERLITYPIESTMNGLPGVTQIKSTSAFGMAVVYVYFKDNVDIYFARQLVAERLAAAMAELPEMDEPPTLGPISTGLGQIFIYYLTIDEHVDTEGKDPNTYLRELNDWVVKFQLKTVPGVTDILSIGGHVLQYQIRVNPDALLGYGLSLEDLVEAVRENNENVGGQFLVIGAEESLVRGLGLLESLEDIRRIPIKVRDGVAVTLTDVAEVAYGNEIRRGVVTRNGEKEVVSGMVLKLFGENTSEVIERLYQKVEVVRASLPEGVSLVPYYEQAELVAQATWTVKKALAEGAILVVLVLLLFLGNLRTALIVTLSLPLCALISIILMSAMGISANLMSLGGIAIALGMLVDGSIVMVENIHRHLGMPESQTKDKGAVILGAAREVSLPIVFSLGIVILVFLPILTLEGVEGKMFSPMAETISFALVGSIIAALIMAPALSYYILKQGLHGEPKVVAVLKTVYRPLLVMTLRRKHLVVAVASAAFVASLAALPFIGTEFIPTLEEGSILIGVTMAPSISLEQATDTVMRLEREIIKYPEVKETVSRIGRPEAGSHPHPVNYAEIHIGLHPSGEWTRFEDKPELVAALRDELSAWPGIQLNFTQPIQNAFDELLSGIRAQLAIKLYGEDLDILREKANEISTAIEDVPGLVDLSVEQSFGQPQVQIVADRAACSRYGIAVSQIQEMVELAIGGAVIDTLYLHTRRFGIHVRFREDRRVDSAAIRNILVPTKDGSLVPLSQVAVVQEVVGPIQVNREKNQRRWVVQSNVRGRDMGGVIADIRQRIASRVDLPPGYYVEYGGQFENQQRAMARLSIIVPIVIAGVFIMLCMSFHSTRHALIIIASVPLAVIGGVLGLIISGEYLSVPASVGLIALFGVALQDAVVMVSYFNQLRAEGLPLTESLIEGGLLRLRPVVVTTLTTLLGLLPLLLARGTGAEVQRPLAVVVVFGLASSTLLTLFVIPAVYGWLEARQEQRAGVLSA